MILKQAEETYDWWKEKATQAQKDIGKVEAEKFQSDPDFANEMMTFIKQCLADADVNNNGVLNGTELNSFIKKLIKAGTKRGNFEDSRPDTIASQQTLCDQISQQPGVSLEDFMRVISI